MRKRVSYILILLAVFLLCGCSKEEKKLTGEYRRYYLNPSETTLVKEAYDPKERTTEKMVYEMTDILKEMVEDGDYIRLMPKDVDIQDITFEDQIVEVDFNAAYKQMENTREILVRAGIVKSYVQIPGVTYVQFKINGEPLTDSNGEVYGNMDKDTFAEGNGNNINPIISKQLNLYFANEAGDHLVKETSQIYYNSNVPLERVIIEHVIKGPSQEGMQPTLSPDTKILGVSIVDGVCYVNLDKTFLTKTLTVQEKLPIYSIVNSLMDACKIHGVKITVEGESKVVFRESMDLDQLYKVDYELVEER